VTSAALSQASAHPTPDVASAAVASSAALPANVTITLQSTPKHVQVYFAGKKLGDSSAPLSLPRTDTPVDLTITAPGHKPKVIKVTPNADAVITVKLKPARTKVIKKGTPGEIENPF
jgi:serine/threonine-protein kinase